MPLSRREFLHHFFSSLATAGTLLGEMEPLEGPLDALRRWREEGGEWEKLRGQFGLDPKVVYLNTGTLGACPRVVVEAHAAFLRRLESNPARLQFGEMGAGMAAVRRRAAALLGAEADEVALTASTTEGMNLIATGLDLRAGDEVLTTTQEHPGGLAGWQHLAERRGIVLRAVALPAPPRDEEEILQALRRGLRRRTRVLSLSHVNTVTGLRLPVAAAARLARERGLRLVIDGAQAPGMLKVDVHALGCDAYASSSHKWLLAPKGCGLLYLRREFQKEVRPAFLREGLAPYTAATGTRNVPQILAHGVAIDFHQFLGPARVQERVLSLARSLRQRLRELPELRLASPAHPDLDSAIMTVQLPRGTGEAAARELFERGGLVVKAVPPEHLEGHGLRVSTHFYNTEAELDRLVEGLKQVL